ncbi:hypothetical protein AVEN_82449-1 [Araneus ventricosus]|uniref:Uncharacterized protein n=1 Tax=Araneus ventricosus TaxID=182803 RepID=A0A4Y2HTL3_ARAVE|nr:hypothetical protein AVEN_82449-1 [Araneus ventricosus]
MATCQVLLQRYEEMKNAWCEIRAVFQCLCFGRAQQFCTSVFVKENRVSIPDLVTLHSLRQRILVDDEFQLGIFSFNAENLLHFSIQSPTMYPSTPPSWNRDFGEVLQI